jgi:hypothetical protein
MQDVISICFIAQPAILYLPVTKVLCGFMSVLFVVGLSFVKWDPILSQFLQLGSGIRRTKHILLYWYHRDFFKIPPGQNPKGSKNIR